MKKFLSILLSIFIIFIQAGAVLAFDYDFSDEAQAEYERKEAQEKIRIQNEDAKSIKTDPKLEKVKRKSVQTQTYTQQDIVQPQQKPLIGTVVIVPKNESFEAVLQSSISSESLANNDIIAATLCHDWCYDGTLIAPQGSVVYGKATDIKKAGYAYANGKLAMTFDEILTPSGDRIRLTSNKVYIEVQNKRALKLAGNVALGAVGGLVTGVLYSLAGGMVSAVAHKGENAEVPAGTVVTVRLVMPVEVVPYE